jgi:ribosome-interacting GTPase 1
MKDIRKLMYVSGLIRKEFTLEDVIEVVETIIEYQPSLTKESDYN